MYVYLYVSFTVKIADKNTAWSKYGDESRIAYAYLHHNKPKDCSVCLINSSPIYRRQRKKKAV